MTRSDGRSTGTFRLDSQKLLKRMRQLGLSKTALADKAGVKRATVYAALGEKGVWISTARVLCDVLGVDVEEVLLDRAAESERSEVVGNEWKVEAPISPWITASNGLQFRLYRMQHLLLDERRGRGKCYDLQHLSSALQEELREHLLRHAKVSERIGPHPHLAETLNAVPGERPGIMWVVDRLIEGATLEEQLLTGPYPARCLPRLMREIAEGLHALHEKEVVFRELAPRRVIVEQGTGRIVLTDFELAKLLSGARTVSAEWPDDPYRAPEVETGQADARADLYSWARVLVHASVGHLPDVGKDAEALAGVDLPREVRKVARDCLSPAPSDRPKSIDPVLRAVRAWAGEA